uniref:Uncharacterized protein n=1 Tax=Arundo donax TaxID=35708 RepID=A0A0A9A5Q5_ARUDO
MPCILELELVINSSICVFKNSFSSVLRFYCSRTTVCNVAHSIFEIIKMQYKCKMFTTKHIIVQ